MGDAMEVVIGRQIAVSNPSPQLLVWCEQNLVLPNPEFEKKLRMGFWTGNTPKTLSLYEIRGNRLLLPYGTLAQLALCLNNGSVRSEFVTSPTVDYSGEQKEI